MRYTQRRSPPTMFHRILASVVQNHRIKEVLGLRYNTLGRSQNITKARLHGYVRRRREDNIITIELNVLKLPKPSNRFLILMITLNAAGI